MLRLFFEEQCGINVKKIDIHDNHSDELAERVRRCERTGPQRTKKISPISLGTGTLTTPNSSAQTNDDFLFIEYDN